MIVGSAKELVVRFLLGGSNLRQKAGKILSNAEPSDEKDFYMSRNRNKGFSGTSLRQQ